jgi:hypothetical protein
MNIITTIKDKNDKKDKMNKTNKKNNVDKEKSIMYCSPARFSMGVKDKTCLTTSELQEVAKEYNKFSQKMGKKKTIKISVDKDTIVKQMKNKLGNQCGNSDFCWVQQEFIPPQVQNKILKKAFRPLKPIEWYKNRQTWLNTYDILKVMKQYEDKYKDFLFVGVFPVDFESFDEYGQCIASGMCEFNIKNLIENGKKRFGMVLNLDKHDQSGSHWVAIYCNLLSNRNNFGIYYYDSVAYPPPKEIASFMKKIEQQSYTVFSKKVADRFAMRYNRIQKQFDNFDCGMFSEVFITQMLKNINFDNICKYMKTDNEINQLRDVMYTPSYLKSISSISSS